MRSWTAAALVTALVLGCTESATVGITNRAQIAEKVAAQLTVWTRAVNNRSLDTLASLYLHSPDLAIVWIDGSQTRGWKEASAKWKVYVDSVRQLNFVVGNPAFDVIDHQVALTTFRMTIDALGVERARHSGRGTQVWSKDPADGRWKIRAEHQSIVPER